MTERSSRLHNWLFGVYLLWNLTLVGLSVLIAIRTSLRLYSGGIPTRPISFQNYRALGDPLFVSTLVVTVKLAVIVAVLATALAAVLVVCVWHLQNAFYRQAVLFGLASVYFAGVVPRTQAMVFLFSPQGPLHAIAAFFGNSTGTGLLYSQQGVVIGFLPLLLPLATAVVAVFRYAIPEPLIDAARDLGASPFDITVRIVWPLLVPGLVISGVLCFVLVLGDVIVVDLLGGSQVYTLAAQVVDGFKVNDWGGASAVTVVILTIMGILLGAVTAAVSKIVGNK